MLKKRKPNIGIVEDDENYKKEIESILVKKNNVFSFHSAEELLQYPHISKLDLIYADIGLPRMNGIELTGIIIAKFPKMKIVILSGMNSDELIFKSIRFGSLGFIHKSDLKDINEITEQILKGGAIISPSIAVRVLHSFRKDKETVEIENLTVREKQVLDQILSGLSTKECAELMSLSEFTLRTHIRNIYSKLQVKNRVELMRKASELGI
ncbi:MAG: response regulator transcription factor [Leptospiraceae bacterium]|nr:response regulator transcription factor [Leptospiraceae bacterium]MCK6381305.1 response regulator transcription factor [Leptospiraceae bacterium]NUM42952.1 response regulator transcription factor [Leptospiraceae bacterium]